MSKVYLTGDTHGRIDIHKLSKSSLQTEGITLNPEDYLIILGDFGLPFLDADAEQIEGAYVYWMSFLEEKECTILWVDGNHDNFNFWEKQPVTTWHGGRVQIHPKASNVIHLMRGEVYEINGESFFVMGGARSTDRMYRKEGYSWWQQEMPSQEEYQWAEENLKKHNLMVDYVLTHCCSSRVQYRIDSRFSRDGLTDWLGDIETQLEFKHWYFGHYHLDVTLDEQHTCLYQRVLPLGAVIKED